MKTVRVLHNTIGTTTGPVRRGDVIEIPDDLAAHWTEQGIVEGAGKAKPTRGVPMVEDEQGQWSPDQAEIDRLAADRPPDTTVGAITRADVGGGPTVTEPTSGPMTGRNEAEAPPAPTVAEVAEPGEPGTVPAEPTAPA
jgi:hypothetical protein